MGILDRLRRKKNPVVDEDVERHHTEALDYFEESEKENFIHCPECGKENKHVHMVETEGESLECPECHYLMEARRM